MEEELQKQDTINHSKESVKFVCYGTVIAMLIAVIIHFIGDKIGGFIIMEGVFPINESIWEHMKLGLYPAMFVTLIPWCDYVRKRGLKERIIMAASSALIAQSVVLFGYYGFKYGLNIEGMTIDITLLVVGLLLGLIHAAMMSDDNICECVKWVCIAYLAIMIVCYYVFAFAPLNVPLFIPPTSA